MRKEKIIAVVLGSCMVLALAGLGFALWRAQNQSGIPKNHVKSATTESVLQTDEQPSGGLSVGDNSGIGGGINGQAQSLGSTTGGLASPSQPQTQKETQSKQQDFSSYDKYKDGKSALFGEISVGTGAEASVNKKLSIYYKGWLTDGTLFDQSRPDKPGGTLQPLIFTLGEHKVITGMEQGVYGMKVGGKRMIIVPPVVGYGTAGKDPIPPNSVMVFEVELLSVE